RIHLDLAPPDDLDATGDADPRLVVPVDIGAHRQFALVLFRIEQFEDPVRILERIAAARDRAADRAGLDALALDPDVHLGRGRDEKFALAEIYQRAIGRGVGAAQPVEDEARAVGARCRQELAGDYLEEIAANKRLLRAAHQRGVFAGAVVAFGRRRRGRIDAIRRW